MNNLRDMPGVAEIEEELERLGPRSTPSYELSERIDELSIALFGITDIHTGNGSDEAWEEQFAPLRLMRDESDTYWAERGWDVTNGAGRQLEVMDFLGRVLICAVNRSHPDSRLPKGTSGDAEIWGARLAEEARRFNPT